MRFLWRWLKRLILLTVVLVLALLAPVAYVEFTCQGDPEGATNYASILPPEHHRLEARTLMTYPEWHIVHAYDDYAEVIRTGDPVRWLDSRDGGAAPVRAGSVTVLDLGGLGAARIEADQRLADDARLRSRPRRSVSEPALIYAANASDFCVARITLHARKKSKRRPADRR